jgi:hypothetical protein
MNAAGPNPLSDPFARLEARVRWLTALCSFLTLGLVALVLWQFAPRPKVVEANTFVLRDHQWRRRGELGLREDGSPILRLNSPAGRARLVLFARDDGQTVIRMFDAQNVGRALLALDQKGQPYVLLAGTDGRSRVALGPAGGAYAGLTLYGDDRKEIWSAP